MLNPEGTILRGRTDIRQYLLEKWGIVMGLKARNALETKYGLPVKIVIGKAYANTTNLDEWAKRAIENQILPLILIKKHAGPGRPRKTEKQKERDALRKKKQRERQKAKNKKRRKKLYTKGEKESRSH